MVDLPEISPSALTPKSTLSILLTIDSDVECSSWPEKLKTPEKILAPNKSANTEKKLLIVDTLIPEKTIDVTVTKSFGFINKILPIAYFRSQKRFKCATLQYFRVFVEDKIKVTVEPPFRDKIKGNTSVAGLLKICKVITKSYSNTALKDHTILGSHTYYARPFNYYYTENIAVFVFVYDRCEKISREYDEGKFQGVRSSNVFYQEQTVKEAYDYLNKQKKWW